jgi:photosystem II stability/assembly factor-like uncharacterized protein
MKNDETLEREVRASLRASAAHPIPDDLVARIGAIPAGQPSSQGTVARLPRYARIAAELAAAAVVVVAVSALILARNGGNTSGGPLGPGATSPATPAASAAPAAVATPSPSPSATPAETVAPAAVLGLAPASVTFVSADVGWVLGTGACAGGPCAAIARTGDGGRTWSPAPAPPTAMAEAPGQATSGVSGLRFADTNNGWAFGPDLWATHDGGTTWARVTIPGVPADAPVFALETAGGIVHAAVLDGGDFRVASSPVGSDGWSVSPVRVPVGAGPVPVVQLVLSGAAGWLVENDRTVVGGARLANGSWVAWTPPCADVVGPAFLTASSPTELAAACDVGLWSNPTGDHLYLSHDGGSTFSRSGTAAPLTTAAMAAMASPSAVVVGGSDGTGSVLAATTDAGRTWKVVARLPAGQIADLGFTTATQGVVIVGGVGGSASLLMTRDGGQTWHAVAVAGS